MRQYFHRVAGGLSGVSIVGAVGHGGGDGSIARGHDRHFAGVFVNRGYRFFIRRIFHATVARIRQRVGKGRVGELLFYRGGRIANAGGGLADNHGSTACYGDVALHFHLIIYLVAACVGIAGIGCQIVSTLSLAIGDGCACGGSNGDAMGGLVVSATIALYTYRHGSRGSNFDFIDHHGLIIHAHAAEADAGIHGHHLDVVVGGIDHHLQQGLVGGLVLDGEVDVMGIGGRSACYILQRGVEVVAQRGLQGVSTAFALKAGLVGLTIISKLDVHHSPVFQGISQQLLSLLYRVGRRCWCRCWSRRWGYDNGRRVVRFAKDFITRCKHEWPRHHRSDQD